MKLKDVTIDQAIEIAKLAYGHNNWIRSNFKVSYIPQENSDVLNGIYEDSPEMLQIFFRGISFGEKIDRYRLIIYSNLNLSFNIIRNELDKPIELITVGIYNQYNIIKKFEQWNIEPEKVEIKEEKIEKKLTYCRLGRKQKRALLDQDGLEITIFNKKFQHLADKVCKLLNEDFKK